MTFESKRNQVELVKMGSGLAVRKTFRLLSDYENELAVYRRLSGYAVAAPAVLDAHGGILLLSYIKGITALDLLEQQESAGVADYAPWQMLSRWITAFWRQTGLCPADANLRNYLYVPLENKCYGVDFESCAAGDAADTAASLIAYLLSYAPADTAFKRKIAAFLSVSFSGELEVPLRELEHRCAAEYQRIRVQRNKNRESFIAEF